MFFWFSVTLFVIIYTSCARFSHPATFWTAKIYIADLRTSHTKKKKLKRKLNKSIPNFIRSLMDIVSKRV